MYTNMDKWLKIRRRVLVEGVSKRQVCREEHIHQKTLAKILTHSAPPGYRQRQPRAKRQLGPYLEWIQQVLVRDQGQPTKQRHTAKRIYERLRAEQGYPGGYTAIREVVREFRQRHQEVYFPLPQEPGAAQVDFGEAVVRVAGVLQKVTFFFLALPYSDSFFVWACPRECTETFWEGHVRAFEFFGGVPRRITYDNLRIAVVKVLPGPGHERQLTYGFQQLLSHYLFEDHFCNVQRANEKGVVELTVKYVRQNFLVPVPQVASLEELNARLAAACVADRERRVRGAGATKAERLEEDQAAFRPLPAATFDACRKCSTMASSLSLVRFDNNDYSVPVRYAHHPVVVKGYVDRVVVFHRGQEIAEHERCWEREQVFPEPEHYLALLERKPGGLDHARPFVKWPLPACFEVLRRRLELERGGEGTREYIRVLRFLERYPLRRVQRVVERGLRLRIHTRDALAQFLLPPDEWVPVLFCLDRHAHLRGVQVAPPELNGYRELLSEGGVA